MRSTNAQQQRPLPEAFVRSRQTIHKTLCFLCKVEKQMNAGHPPEIQRVLVVSTRWISVAWGLALITSLHIFLSKNKIAHRWKSGTNFIYSIFFQPDYKPLKISILGIMGLLCIFH